jgi:hypothetical protein
VSVDSEDPFDGLMYGSQGKIGQRRRESVGEMSNLSSDVSQMEVSNNASAEESPLHPKSQ